MGAVPIVTNSCDEGGLSLKLINGRDGGRGDIPRITSELIHEGGLGGKN